MRAVDDPLPRPDGRDGAPSGPGHVGPDLPAQRPGRASTTSEARSDRTAEALDATLWRRRPLWAQSAVGSLDGTERRSDPTERVHQSRVAMRRIRSNLRTFRLLLDPGWGTSLAGRTCLVRQPARTLPGPRHAGGWSSTAPAARSSTAEDVARLLSVVDTQRRVTSEQMAALRSGPRRARLTEQMMVLWEGPEFKPKAQAAGDRRAPGDAAAGLARSAGRGPHRPEGRPRTPISTGADPAQGPALRLRDRRPGRGGSGRQDRQGGRAAAEQAR